MNHDLNFKIIFSFLGFMSFIVLYILLVVMPFSMHAHKKCLEAGYPHTTFTYDFDIYCSTLQGDVSIKLEKQK